MDWDNYFTSVSKPDTGREQITYIPLNLLDSDEQNFYSLSEIPALADNIATVGLQQPLRVRKHPTAEGRFMVVSGHRRRAALEELSKEDPERWAEVACIIQAESASPALQQLQLIYANSGTRKLSSSDMSEQAVQVEKLLYQLQQEGHEFPGRMRDHVAKVMQTTNTKLATLKKIREHLAECWQPHYKSGTVKESAAYELAKLDPADQKFIYDVLHQTKRNLSFEYAADFQTYATRMDDVCNGECADCSKDARDIAVYQKRCRAVSLTRYSNFHCELCCSECDDLGTCKYACPAFSDKVNAIKAQKKENAQRLKAEQEERERPTIELLKLLWQRFGEARRASGYSVADVYSAIGKYFAPASEQNVLDLESGVGKFSAYSTVVPDAEQYVITYANRLRAMADLFGVTTDFLLGRTDDPSTPAAAWNTGNPVSIGKYVALVSCGESANLHPYKLTWDGIEWLHSGRSLAETGVNVICWIGMPEDAQSSDHSPFNNSCKTGMSPSGHCGAAAYCGEPVDCCMNCDKDCNSRCGHMEVSGHEPS
jgi:ParB family chromosome partitioning protein